MNDDMQRGRIEFDDPHFRPYPPAPAASGPVPSARERADADMLERWRAHRTGLAPYYPFLYSLVIGMGAQRVFEFGTGESTEVLRAALEQTGGHLVVCSPVEGETGTTTVKDGRMTRYQMLSSEVWKYNHLGPDDLFDLVLHDGSHSADVVAADLAGILPRVRHGGLVLIHDTLHSYVGEQVREGVFLGRDGRHGEMPETARLTLPFAFGLTLVQVEGNAHLGPVSIGPDKPSSPHHTRRWGEEDDA